MPYRLTRHRKLKRPAAGRSSQCADVCPAVHCQRCQKARAGWPCCEQQREGKPGFPYHMHGRKPGGSLSEARQEPGGPRRGNLAETWRKQVWRKPRPGGNLAETWQKIEFETRRKPGGNPELEGRSVHRGPVAAFGIGTGYHPTENDFDSPAMAPSNQGRQLAFEFGDN